jgi:hypothetical protein
VEGARQAHPAAVSARPAPARLVPAACVRTSAYRRVSASALAELAFRSPAARRVPQTHQQADPRPAHPRPAPPPASPQRRRRLGGGDGPLPGPPAAAGPPALRPQQVRRRGLRAARAAALRGRAVCGREGRPAVPLPRAAGRRVGRAVHAAAAAGGAGAAGAGVGVLGGQSWCARRAAPSSELLGALPRLSVAASARRDCSGRAGIRPAISCPPAPSRTLFLHPTEQPHAYALAHDFLRVHLVAVSPPPQASRRARWPSARSTSSAWWCCRPCWRTRSPSSR